MTAPIPDGPKGPGSTVEGVEWIDPTPPQRPGRRAPKPPQPHPSIPTLITEAVEDGKRYFEAQLEIFKLKAMRAAKQASGSIVMLLGAVLFALLLLGWIFHSGEVALRLVVPDWAAALIVSGILLLLVIIFGAVGAILALGAKNDAPDPKAMVEDDIETLKSDFAQAKEGLKK